MKIPKYIKRPVYMDRIMPYVRKDIMKILVGQRRVGKSYLLFQLMDRLTALHPEDQQIKISHNLVINYLSYLSSAQLVLQARRYDIAGKKNFEIGEKYYFEDLGIRHAMVGFNTSDINKIIENVIFTHLKTAGYEVTVGQLEKRKPILSVKSKGNTCTSRLLT